eukprot:11451259-Alexandrium_andersonii.AAC.1
MVLPSFSKCGHKRNESSWTRSVEEDERPHKMHSRTRAPGPFDLGRIFALRRAPPAAEEASDDGRPRRGAGP